MAVSFTEISKRLEMQTDELEKKSVLSFVAREIRLAEWDIADIKERYGVSSRAELESNIQRQITASHPASFHWERRAKRGVIHRFDNAPDFPDRLTSPKHFHNGSETQVESSQLSDDPETALREFLSRRAQN